MSLNTHQRKALLRALLGSLVINGRLVTTESRAKVIQRLVEKLITKAKTGTLHSQRLVAAFLQNKVAVEKMVKIWGPLFKNRPGGFTRIVRLGKRPGDNALKARLEFVASAVPKENNENKSNQKK